MNESYILSFINVVLSCPNQGQNTNPWAWHCWTPGLVSSKDCWSKSLAYLLKLSAPNKYLYQMNMNVEIGFRILGFRVSRSLIHEDWRTSADKIIKQISFVISDKVWPLQVVSLSPHRRPLWPESEWELFPPSRAPALSWVIWVSERVIVSYIVTRGACTRVIICQCSYWHIRGFVFRHFRKWENSIGWFHAEFVRIRTVRITPGLVSSPEQDFCQKWTF